MNYFLVALKKYAIFTGRSRRSEFWFFNLFCLIFAMVLTIIDMIIGDFGILNSIFSLFVLIPNISVAIRRMHDVGKCGWYCLIPIYNIVLAISDSEIGVNKYGPNPKETPSI